MSFIVADAAVTEDQVLAAMADSQDRGQQEGKAKDGSFKL